MYFWSGTRHMLLDFSEKTLITWTSLSRGWLDWWQRDGVGRVWGYVWTCEGSKDRRMFIHAWNECDVSYCLNGNNHEKTWRGFLVSCLIFDWRTDWIFIVWQKWVGIIICWKLNMVINLMYSTECFRISRSLGSLRSTLVVLKIF